MLSYPWGMEWNVYARENLEKKGQKLGRTVQAPERARLSKAGCGQLERKQICQIMVFGTAKNVKWWCSGA